MFLFRRVLCLILLVYLSPKLAHAACGDGILESADILYGADGADGQESNLYILNPSTGSMVRNVGPIGFPVTGLAIHPSTGELFGVTSGQPSDNPGRGFLIQINEITGQGTPIGDVDPNTTNTIADITFAPDGTLFGWLEDFPAPGFDDLVMINLSTGVAKIVGDSTLSTHGSGLATFDGSTLFLVSDGTTGDLSSIDALTGLEIINVNLNGYSGMGEVINALDFNAEGVLYGSLIVRGASRNTKLITIDTATGLITTLGSSVNRLDAIAFAMAETCDDGNTSSGDGCSSDCQTIETGFSCDLAGEPCEAICGNGSVEGTEVCDDENTVAGDGCSADCQVVETGYVCPTTGGLCTSSGALTGSGCSLNGAVLNSTAFWVHLISSAKIL